MTVSRPPPQYSRNFHCLSPSQLTTAPSWRSKTCVGEGKKLVISSPGNDEEMVIIRIKGINFLYHVKHWSMSAIYAMMMFCVKWNKKKRIKIMGKMKTWQVVVVEVGWNTSKARSSLEAAYFEITDSFSLSLFFSTWKSFHFSIELNQSSSSLPQTEITE